MNRKDRRAAGKQGKGGMPGAPAPGLSPAAMSANLFAGAVQHFRAGELERAERLCRDVLVFDRDHGDALHLLGMIAFKAGNQAAALELLGRAVALNGGNADCHFNIAQVLRSLGRLAEAADHLTQATAIKRDHATAHVCLADMLLQQGKLDEARARYGRAAVIEPANVGAHYGQANALMQQGLLDEAIAHYRRVLALKPDFAEAHSNLGIALAAQGKYEEAAAQYQRALALRPDLVDTYRNLVRVLLAKGDAEAALAAVRRALAIAETDEIKALFVQGVRSLAAVAPVDELSDLIARALSEGWSRPSELSAIAARLLKQHPVLGALIEQAAWAWPQRLAAVDLCGAEGPAGIAGDRLMRALLGSAPVCDIDLERFLTSARAALLERAAGAAASDAIDDGSLEFYATLARQCFINEYVFALTDDETQRVRQLRATLEAALVANTAAAPLWLVAAAAYEPLHSLAHAATVLERSWPAALGPLLDLQIRQPLQERQIRSAIRVLTTVDDNVSLLVQRQYEDMPYPRWLRAAPLGKPVALDWYLRNQFPAAPIRSAGPRDGLDVLIAGCGTGQHAIETAQRFAGASVLAIDLSLSSLSYAARKTRALGLGNLHYAQADILKLNSTGWTFDLIEASGVLHHLRDWTQGWRVLLSLLRPGGFMHVGLYSALARADILAARAFIAEHGYGQSADDIRRCRQELLDLDPAAPLRNVAMYPDFYTISECRDLLFHVQEHNVTIPEIAVFLRDNDLTFIGFTGAAGADYRRRFPNDQGATDLAQWHAFETGNPLAFTGMYQFWVQKP
ncbi:MAG: hypothetical protein QOI12_174 [Alphaproteobacteria bacterium]|jgi:tetratricopeptide (TPR) repeat protein/SAM-dependent methyltransferase|nr:hypothetical protein [Alphaproteobacteria bacterium]